MEQVPVITSNVFLSAEVGGDAVYYVNPTKREEIAAGMKRSAMIRNLQRIREKGCRQAKKFLTGKLCEAVMNVYKRINFFLIWFDLLNLSKEPLEIYFLNLKMTY
jgi:hypothetical protein